jgi:hypothetical protein
MQPHETLDPTHRDENDAEGHHHSGDHPADDSPLADHTTPEHPEHPENPEWAADTERSEVDGDDVARESIVDSDAEVTPDDDDSTRLGYGQPGHAVSEDGAPGYENAGYQTGSHDAGHRLNGTPDAGATEAPDEDVAETDDRWGDEAQADVVPAADAAALADAAPVDGQAVGEQYPGQPYDNAAAPADSYEAGSEPVAVDPDEAATAAVVAGAPASGSAAVAAVSAEALPGATDPTAGQPLVSDAAGLRNRWRDVQAGFVDDPADAVRAAAGLVEEAVQARVAALHQQRETLEATAGEARTEQLRVALRRYRTVFDRLLTDESASS